jgi:hypothetical protein
VVVTATGVSAVTGSAADYATLVAAATASVPTITLGSASFTASVSGVIGAAAVDALADLTSGIVTATITPGTAAVLNAALNDLGGQINAYTITVNGTADAADLNALDSKTSVAIAAKAVTLLTGAAANIATAVSVPSIDTASNVGVTVDAGPVAATDLNKIDANTSALVDGTSVTVLNGSDVDVARAITSRGLNLPVDVPVTITHAVGHVDSAANLLVIDYNTSGVITATAVTSISGNYTDVTALYAADVSGQILLNNTEAVMLSDTVTVAQGNAIAAVTSGFVTATIVNTDMATLANLTETGNAYSITVADASVSASALNTLDGKTTVAVNATAVATLTGAASDILTAIAAGGITTSTSYAAVVSGSASVANLNTMDADTTGVITATVAEHDLATL